MIDTITIILWGGLGLGIVIFIHESGHFIAAKILGIEVETFSLGWGKKLVGFTRKGTTYQLAVFPLGGYCKMKGEHVLTDALQNNVKEIPREEGTYFGVPPWKRIIVSFSGPFANLVFAVIVLTFIWWIGFPVYSPDNRIILASDYALDSFPTAPPAAQAGLKTGDRVIAVNNNEINNFKDMRKIIAISAREELQFIVERGPETFALSVIPDLNKEDGRGTIGIYPWIEPVIGEIGPEMKELNPWLKTGDEIISVNGEKIEHHIAFLEALHAKPASVPVSIMRDGVISDHLLQLAYLETDDNSVKVDLQFTQKEFHTPPLNPVQAFLKGIDEAVSTIGLTIKSFGLLFSGINLNKAVAGPIRITYEIGRIAKSGFERGIGSGLISFFYFICMISVIILFMNLLPIPVLDGGFILLFTYEAIRKKPLTFKLLYRFQLIGVSIILLLIVFAITNDLTMLFRQGGF
ncbi:MAG: RIP metalloprotease RseP [Spirochaetales bacterium]|nr:RIP metalloprotease RseP [Spirochaetales bacterium]